MGGKTADIMFSSFVVIWFYQCLLFRLWLANECHLLNRCGKVMSVTVQFGYWPPAAPNIHSIPANGQDQTHQCTHVSERLNCRQVEVWPRFSNNRPIFN